MINNIPKKLTVDGIEKEIVSELQECVGKNFQNKLSIFDQKN